MQTVYSVRWVGDTPQLVKFVGSTTIPMALHEADAALNRQFCNREIRYRECSQKRASLQKLQQRHRRKR